ncbi:hypothetical protein GGS21DRAFT_493975 [Xylaria nigripes]|nr:hypothetical protein GGS21DRAFT_493975 [Xylaria nigripes]
MPAPIFNLDFSSPRRSAASSPLSSSPLRPSQSPPPISPRGQCDLVRRETQSSPIQGPSSRLKYASRNVKPNPLRLTRDKAQESRRTLFLKNVYQRSEDKKWQLRGGDQEALKLEWNVLNKRRRQEKDTDLDGFVFDDELEDIPKNPQQVQQEADSIMVDVIAQQEEAELNATLSSLTTGSFTQELGRSENNLLSDDEDYDALFLEMLSQQDSHAGGLTSPNQMDLS